MAEHELVLAYYWLINHKGSFGVRVMGRNSAVKSNNISVTSITILLLFSFSSLDLFQHDGKTFFFYVELIFLICFILFKKRGRINLLKDPLIIAIFLEFFLSGVLAQLQGMNATYKKTALVMPILVLPIYFLAGSFEYLIHHKIETINWIKKGLRIACVIQFVFIPIQFALYRIWNIDINELLFVDKLGMVPSASFIRDWVWYPSGLTNHSAIVAPLMIIGFVLFENMYFRLLIIMDSLLCGSSSAIVGVFVTLVLLFWGKLINNRNSRMKRKVLVSVMVIILFLLVILLTTNALDIITNKVGYIINRLFGDSKDSSTNAHLLYYFKYPSIFRENSLPQNLFGYGYGCSGYIFSMLDNRTNIGNWAVETDIMDRIYSLGIVGFILYYSFLSKILVRGYRIDKKYTVVIIALIIQGFGYNIQWDYIFLIELIFYICINNNISFFDSCGSRRKNFLR